MMVDGSEAQMLINNNILASRYVANMKTFGFVPRHQFHLKLFRFWLYIYINSLNRLNFRGFVVERMEL